jgi:hypothetical protein
LYLSTEIPNFVAQNKLDCFHLRDCFTCSSSVINLEVGVRGVKL